MNLIVVLLILLSAFLHVTWNLIGKSIAPSGAFFLIASIASAVIISPAAILIGPDFGVLGELWIYLVLAGFFQAVYYTGLGNAYRHGDMSLAYPIARSLPVLFILLISIIFGGAVIPVQAVSGMIMVTSGCIILPIRRFREFSFRAYMKSNILFILQAAIGTSAYTIIDSAGMKLLHSSIEGRSSGMWGNSVFYIAFETMATAVFLLVYTAGRSRERKLFKNLLRKDLLYTISAGFIITLAYGIILTAYPLAENVSFVAAFRQISIPLGALAGIIFLKERKTTPKLIGTIIIFAGLLFVYV